MSEPKNRQIMVNLEETLYSAVQRLTARLGSSASGYARSLMIKDMQERGILTNEMMTRMLGAAVSYAAPSGDNNNNHNHDE